MTRNNNEPLVRKVIVSIMVSVDGFFEDTNKELNWHVWDKEMDNYVIDLFDTVDTILLGRKAYQLMAGYWPKPPASEEDPIITGKMNNIPKIVFSKTLSSVDWQNTRLINTDIENEIDKLKQQPGKNMVLFGGADMLATLMKLNLVDEYRLIVNPVVLGKGNPLFKSIQGNLNLKLTETKTFTCGNVLLCYEPLKS